MDCEVDDDLFDLLIEYDENSIDGGDMSEKENTTEGLQFRRKPTTKQYKMMKDFFDKEGDYSEIGRDLYDQFWERLTPKLNDIGPPVYSHLEWRRKWTVYKHNLSKKQTSSSKREDNLIRQNSHSTSKISVEHYPEKCQSSISLISNVDEPEETRSKKLKRCALNQDERQTNTLSESQDTDFHRKVLEKLDTIICNQEVMIKNQSLIFGKLNSP